MTLILRFEDLRIWQDSRELVMDAVKLTNGYMNYLRRASKNDELHDDISEYTTSAQTDNY